MIVMSKPLRSESLQFVMHNILSTTGVVVGSVSLLIHGGQKNHNNQYHDRNLGRGSSIGSFIAVVSVATAYHKFGSKRTPLQRNLKNL